MDTDGEEHIRRLKKVPVSSDDENAVYLTAPHMETPRRQLEAIRALSPDTLFHNTGMKATHID